MDALSATRCTEAAGTVGGPADGGRAAALPVPRQEPRQGGTGARRAPRVRPAPRPVPELLDTHVHLGLDELRSYRGALQSEEGRVSYWRRILQARLDVVQAGRTLGGTTNLDVRTLSPVLGERRVGAGRIALIQVLPDDDIPPLPNLRELWERRVAPDDADAAAGLQQDLQDAEQQLSAYRTALHVRLGDATGELIARYRQQPGLCLSSLPLRPGHTAP